MDTTEKWRLFWAKTDRTGLQPDWTRPLWAHLIDVANTASVLWDCHVSSALKQQLSEATGLSVPDAGRWWSLMIGLHDLGKAIPSFQAQHIPTRLSLERNGFRFPAQFDRVNRIHHGYATIGILERWLKEQTELSGPVKNTYLAIAAFIGFHHGTPVSRTTWINDTVARLGGTQWQTAQMGLLVAVETAWCPPVPTLVSDEFAWPTWVLGLAGWCTLSDWLGSMEEFFPDVAHGDDLQEYIEASRNGAIRAMAEAGFDHRAALIFRPFGEIFMDLNGEARPPRDLQKVTIDRIPVLDNQRPTLTIIEAPTGEGKTEAAFYLALRQQVASKGAGIYIAMPSQATSNGLFNRFKGFLERGHDHDAGPVNLVLIHGASALHKDQELLVRTFLDARRTMSWVDDDALALSPQTPSTTKIEPRVETATWFLPKKRSLLAPYGIGTVDQALLGVLYSKHFFVRLYGLSGKTVIFDEVHAYDTYMSELFHLLLSWLKELGTNVILLSATLPAISRQGFMKAWGTDDISLHELEPVYTDYPVVWYVNDTGHQAFPCKPRFRQSTTLAWGDPTPEAIVQAVLAAVRAGATIAVIANTVRRAQTIHTVLETALRAEQGLADIELVIFHGRFPHGVRAGIENRVLGRFGENRPSLRPAVLIATQVAEQSLDLDVDAMFSDLAPVDLLLQRAGRLHRHQHHKRPAGFTDPVLTILCPEAPEHTLPAIDEISGGGKVYEKAILYRTWRTLRNRPFWTLPDDYRILIESVYGPSGSIPDTELDGSALDCWRQAEHGLTDNAQCEKNQARGRIIPHSTIIRGIIEATAFELEEEDEGNAHRDFIAFTRSGGPSIQAVCLHADSADKLCLDPACSVPLPTELPLSREQIRLIQDVVVRLSGERIFSWLAGMADERWDSIAAKTPGLTRHRPLVFGDRHWYDEKGSHIEYDETLGIIYHTRES